MFTGIIEEVGTITGIQRGARSAVLFVAAKKVLEDIHLGDSIAVNGVCLTVVGFDKTGFSADVMPETLDRSSLGKLGRGGQVNLERAMAAGGRFGGHIVSGHVDGTGVIRNITKDDNAVRYDIAADPQVLRYIVEKGSITIDGISLTVVSVDQEKFQVSVIPHTAEVTILGTKGKGDIVNLENDIIGKYVERLMGFAPQEEEKPGGLTMDFLQSCGF